MSPKSTSSLRDRNSTTQLLKRIPKLSLVLAIISTACIVGCVVVIYTAKGKPLDEYIPFAPDVRPAVLLSLLSNISSVIQKYLFAEGLTVVWWRAIRNGASLSDLHHLWSHGKGYGFMHTLRNLFEHRTLTYWAMSVFLFMNAVSVADTPLLQQAIRPVSRNLTYEYQEPRMGFNDTIEDGWAGQVSNTDPANIVGNIRYDQVLQDWYMNRSMTYLGCPDGTCSGSVSAAGIHLQDFRSELGFIDLTAPEHQNATVFSIMFNRSVDSTGTPVLLMSHSYMLFADVNCNASIISEKRTFRAATVKYDVHSDGSDLRLNRSHWPEVLKDEASKGDLPGNDTSPAGPLAALEYFGYYYLMSFGHSTGREEDGSFAVEPSLGTLVKVYWDAGDDRSANASCPWRYRNATEDLIWNLHEVMFRMAWFSTDETGPSNYSTWTNTRAVLAYEIYPFTLWFAFALMLTCLFAIISLFWGFWTLDREVSLSPLETGRALATTLLDSSNTTNAMDLKNLLRELGDKKVKIE